MLVRVMSALLLSMLCAANSLAGEGGATGREQLKAELQRLADYFSTDPYKPSGGWHQPPRVDVSSLHNLPEGDRLRLDAISLARKYANPAELVRKHELGAGYHVQSHAKLDFAWTTLIRTGCLRPGMRLEEFVAVVGGPVDLRTVRDTTYADWYYSSRMHVNPCLRITLKNDHIETVEIVRR